MLVNGLSRGTLYMGLLLSLFLVPKAQSTVQQKSVTQPTFSAKVYFAEQPAQWRLQAEGPVRLAAAVTSALQQFSPPLSTLSIDWQRARLHYQTDTLTLSNKQLQMLHNGESDVASNQRIAWRSLIRQLQQQQFAKRAWVNLDPDFTRVVEGNNPLLSGQYVLYLPSLKTNGSVMVWGAVSHPTLLPWQPNSTARDYARQTSWINSRLSHVTVIQPNGDIEKHPVGYWLEHTFRVQPGAIIYVPFTSVSYAATTTAQLDELNQWVIETLRHRLPTNNF